MTWIMLCVATWIGFLVGFLTCALLSMSRNETEGKDGTNV